MNSTTAAVSTPSARVQARLSAARLRSDELFSVVRAEAMHDRPLPERHRVIFYLGHLEAFDWNLLHEPLGLSSFDPEFDRLFAFGIDPVDGRLPADQPNDWPSIEDALDYGRQLRARLDAALARAAASDPALAALDGGRLLEVAMEHRLMHVETLCYMLHQIPLDRKYPEGARPPLPAGERGDPGLSMIEIPAGTATLGLSRDGHSSFGWDNEFEEHRVEVPAFSIDRFDVTNAEYLRFVREGGYNEPSFWSDEGWQWITSQNHRHPKFWIPDGDSWRYRGMFAEIPLPLDWPVYVSHDEASAYARWAKKELPSEAEWHRAACGTPANGERAYAWGSGQPSARHGNFDFVRWDPVPVGSYPEGDSAFGVADLFGNGWEWTRTPFEPFPGFEPFPFYQGYSANFFDGKHFVMKGGSPRTAACMLRRSFRNWFQPHYPYVYAAFRGVRR